MAKYDRDISMPLGDRMDRAIEDLKFLDVHYRLEILHFFCFRCGEYNGFEDCECLEND